MVANPPPYIEAMMQNAAAKTTTALMPARVGAMAYVDQSAAERLLQHRRCRADDPNARRDVETQDRPNEPELRCLVRLFQSDMICRDHRLLCGGRRPALRAPSVGRHPVAEGAGDHVDEIAEPKDDEARRPKPES